MAESIAQKNRTMRREAVLEVLRNKGLVQYIFENLAKIEDLDNEMDSIAVQRMQIGIQTRIKLLGKLVPDVKATELTGTDGKDLFTNIKREIVDKAND
jgi:hypothetical protein